VIPSCYLFQGQKPAWFSVVASNLLPVHVTTLSNADAVYEKHAGRELLKVRGAAVVGSQLQTGRPSRLVKHPSWGTTAGKPARQEWGTCAVGEWRSACGVVLHRVHGCSCVRREHSTWCVFGRASVSSIQADKICRALLSDAWLFLKSLKAQAATGIFSMADFRLGFQNRLQLKNAPFLVFPCWILCTSLHLLAV